VSNSEMLKLIERDLSNARSMAEHVAEGPDDGLLLYLIDMAILEVKSKARSDGGSTTRMQSSTPRDNSHHGGVG
jgi:hypothetical protein